jgi:hypothetical protein
LSLLSWLLPFIFLSSKRQKSQTVIIKIFFFASF